MTDPTEAFWTLAESFLAQPSVSIGKLMGFPCLHIDGEFFATADHRSGHLIVKVDADRVQALITEGTGVAFAPAGRTFKEWVEIPVYERERWIELLQEAQDFVGNQPKKRR